MPTNPGLDEQWYRILSEGETVHRHIYHLFGLLPSSPRCKLCNSPFGGLGGTLMRVVGKRPSKNNPRFCDQCEFLTRQEGGTEIELTMLFADARGSTALAESMSPAAFSQLMHRFYNAATGVLVQTDALLDKLVGDEVIGLYVPGFAGPRHARRAVEAAQALLRATGHDDPVGPWLPVGVGIHMGVAFVGVVRGIEGTSGDVTALGDNVNIAARLASQAGPGEILVTDRAYTAAGLDLGDVEHRRLELKGKSGPVDVRVLHVAPR